MRDESNSSRLPLVIVFLALLIAAGCDRSAPSGEEGASESPAATEQSERREAGEEELLSGDDERSVEQKLKDASTAAAVQLALVDARELRRYRFEPVVVNGRVLLRGDVETLSQRQAAEKLTSGVTGVRSVINEITSSEPIPVEPETPEETPDTAQRDTAENIADASESSTDEPSEAQTATPESEETPAPEPESAATYHTVKSGDNLWVISRRYNVTIDQIKRLNNMGSNSIKPGQRLRIK